MNIKFIPVLLALCTFNWVQPEPAAAQRMSVSFQLFYDELSPYGDWVDNSDYGYVWVPNAGSGFRPYATNGYWIYTIEGWTWVSNYSWGWAPFHYGRWYDDPYYGPVWIPGNDWGPGWVTWRRSSGYYGWTPLGPGINISISFGRENDVPANRWTFVRNRNFGRTNMNRYYVNASQNESIYRRSSAISNTRTDRNRRVSYNAGPERKEAEKRAGKTFNPVAINETNKPGMRVETNRVRVYRPDVRQESNTGPKPAPKLVKERKDIPQRNRRTEETIKQRTPEPVKVQPPLPERTREPNRQPVMNRPVKQPERVMPPQRTTQPDKPRIIQPPRVPQPERPPQRNREPVKQPERTTQPERKTPPQRSVQPVRQQPSLPQRTEPQPRKQSTEPKNTRQPDKQKTQPARPNKKNGRDDGH